MGRHSSGRRFPYFLSVTAWAVPWVLLVAVVGATVWFSVTAVGGDDLRVQKTPSDSPSPEASAPPVSNSPAPRPSPTERDQQPREDAEKLIAVGVRVQVLNGTGGIEGAAEAMADRLARLGFEIESIQNGLTTDQTIVYYTGDEDRRPAERLAERFGWLIGPAPEDLSDAVDLHVVVSAADARA